MGKHIAPARLTLQLADQICVLIVHVSVCLSLSLYVCVFV